MAVLKKYSPRTDKRGFYIDGYSWTLQTSFRADQFFRNSNKYHSETQLPKTVIKTLIHLGEAETEGWERKEEMLDWFPHLNPNYCDMDGDARSELREFIVESLTKGGIKKSDFQDFNNFLRKQTPLEPLTWSEEYKK